MSKYYCGFVGGDPPRCNILTYRSLFTLFAHFVCTFKLCLNFSFEIHCFAEVSVDFSMISLAFLLIFWTFCKYFLDILQEFAEDPNKHKKPTLKNPLENPDPWDHAQMIERKILCRIALTRALYDQIRP